MIASFFLTQPLYYTKVLLLNSREQETYPVVILFDKRLFLWYNKNKEIKGGYLKWKKRKLKKKESQLREQKRM